MASLGELLSEEGFRSRKLHGKSVHPSTKLTTSKYRRQSEEVSLPIYICLDRKNSLSRNERKSTDLSRQRLMKEKENGISFSSSSGRASKCDSMRNEELALDEAAVRAIISILSGYIGRFSKDQSFRNSIRQRCSRCLEMKNWKEQQSPEKVILVNMQCGMESIEKLAENHGDTKESRMSSLKNSIRLLSVVACLNSAELKHCFTCGVPNSHLSACAQLYLSVVYKLEKNDRISAKHLLQVFCDSPFQARNYLLPDLWGHFFLPHLLHLRVWYSEEAESISETTDRWTNMKVLSKVYNDQMDLGTSKFAHYYKEWLKVGVEAPPVPSVPVPTKPSYGSSRKSSGSGISTRGPFASEPSINKNLYRAVFGPSCGPERDEKRDSFLGPEGLEAGEGFFSARVSAETNEVPGAEADYCMPGSDRMSYISQNSAAARTTESSHRHSDCHRRSASYRYENARAEMVSEAWKSDYLRFFSCHSNPAANLVWQSCIPRSEVILREPDINVLPSSLNRDIATICTSDSLGDCEIAIRMVAKAWLDSHGDSTVESAISKAPVIEGLLEVLSASEDDEILELAVSILAELGTRNDTNWQIILNADPQLEIFMRLLRNNNLFLKASVLLYFLRPKAKQMLSLDWVPLVLRVLEFGDQLETLFTVQCRPQAAVLYILHQLLTGFDIDKNTENAKQVISLGGLRLLIRRLEIGDSHERNNAALLLCCCIQADGSCRHYLANNIKKTSIVELLLGNLSKSGGCALSLLTELLCLNRRSQVTNFLSGLKNEGCLNTMHILLVYLQRAPLEHRPLVAAILLQLDLLGDPLQYSVYREEVVDAIIAALDCNSHNEKVQEQCGRALQLLGGHFSYVGEASTEAWLLKQAGFNDGFADSFSSNDIVVKDVARVDQEEKETENWLRKAATVFLVNGSKRFWAVLLKSLTNGIPCLSRACLVTVAWMSLMFASVQNAEILSMVCSILAPRLVECLNYDRAVEERVLASLSLQNFARNSECLCLLSPLEKEMVGPLRSLGLVTWTAKELLSLLAKDSTFDFNY